MNVAKTMVAALMVVAVSTHMVHSGVIVWLDLLADIAKVLVSNIK